MLELENLVCGYAKNPILKNISCKIESGKIIFLVGKNGAGKTTLLKTLAGLIAPASGKVTAKMRPIYLPSQISVADMLTGLDINEIYGSKNLVLPWNLPLGRAFSTLSSGEQRQILLNATLSHPSPIVLLDEPFNFLDWNHTFELIEMISKQAKAGRTFILATHGLDWLLRLEATETWALIDTPEKNTRELLAGETKSVLLSEVFQKAFELRIQILNSQDSAGHVLAISKRI